MCVAIILRCSSLPVFTWRRCVLHFSIRNGSCDFPSSVGVILQSDHQAYFKTRVCGASLLQKNVMSWNSTWRNTLFSVSNNCSLFIDMLAARPGFARVKFIYIKLLRYYYSYLLLFHIFYYTKFYFKKMSKAVNLSFLIKC